MSVRAWVRLLAAGLPAVAAAAAAPAPRTLTDCWTAARQRSETVAQSLEQVTQSREHVKQAVGSVLPGLSGVGSYLWQQNVTNGLGSSISPTTQPFAKLMLTQPLFQGFREFAAYRAAKKLVIAQEAGERQTEVQLYEDVSSAFFAVLAAERTMGTFAEELKAYDERIADLQQRVQVGRSRTTEVLAAQSARSALAAQAEQAHGTLVTARETLAFLTGQPADAPVAEETGDVPPPDDLTVYLKAVDDRPDVRSAAARLDAARDGVSVATGSYWPTIGFTGNYYLDRTGLLKDVKWDAQLALTVPLFTGGQTTSKVREARSVLRQNEDGLSLARRAAEEEIRILWARYAADRAQAAALATAVDLAQKTYTQQLADYRLGLANNLDVLTALSNLQEVQRALDGATYLVRADRARLEAAAGRSPAGNGDARS